MEKNKIESITAELIEINNALQQPKITLQKKINLQQRAEALKKRFQGLGMRYQIVRVTGNCNFTIPGQGVQKKPFEMFFTDLTEPEAAKYMRLFENSYQLDPGYIIEIIKPGTPFIISGK